MTPEELTHHNKTAEWLMNHKPHRVLAYLKAMTPDQLAEVYALRTEQDAIAFNGHMHDQVKRYGSN